MPEMCQRCARDVPEMCQGCARDLLRAASVPEQKNDDLKKKKRMCRGCAGYVLGMCIGCASDVKQTKNPCSSFTVFSHCLCYFSSFSLSLHAPGNVVSHPHRDLQSVAVLVSLTWAAAGALAMLRASVQVQPTVRGAI